MACQGGERSQAGPADGPGQGFKAKLGTTSCAAAQATKAAVVLARPQGCACGSWLSVSGIARPGRQYCLHHQVEICALKLQTMAYHAASNPTFRDAAAHCLANRGYLGVSYLCTGENLG